MNILPQHVVEQIGRSAHASQPLRVFWVTLQADRDAFAKQLTMLSETKPIVPCTLRTSGFSDPNSVMNDVTGVLDQERAGILDLKKPTADSGRCRRRYSQSQRSKARSYIVADSIARLVPSRARPNRNGANRRSHLD